VDQHTPGVKPRQAVPESLQQLANLQSGIVSREQVLGHGVSRHVLGRLVDSGAWQPVARSLYSTLPVTPTWTGLAWGGLLLGRTGSRLGPRASGHLHGLVEEAPYPIDILVPADRVIRTPGPWQFQRESPGMRSVRTLGALSHLTVEDTVLDLSGQGPEAEVVGLITRAVSQRLTDPVRLRRALQARARQRHRELLADLLGDVAGGVESPIELRYLKEVERAHSLPRSNPQRSRLGLPYRSDVGYDAFQVLVELDGRRWHGGEQRFRDLDRDNRFAFVDWLTLRYGWYDLVTRPCIIAYQVAEVLIRRGWAGLPTRCSRCLGAPDLDLAG
jgi:hypothetical protein